MRGDGDLWSVLVPVKRLALAKTRLSLGATARVELALAMAIDTVSAAAACAVVGEVVVITDDERAASRLEAIGARVVADRPDAGLNPALVYGATVARGPRVVAMSSDLPALRAADLEGVLALASAHRKAIVADHSGTGTTLLAAATSGDFTPSFGDRSRAAHVAQGATDLTVAAARSLRHDVDTVEALDAARALGLGPATDRALSALSHI
jgi:2-phospho-L-lactate guanylyltransferase